LGTDVVTPWPEGILPGVGSNIGGGITIGLKPGIINLIPVAEKNSRHRAMVMISNFRVKIDGCVGQSFIRSYAVLTRSTDESEAVLAWARGRRDIDPRRIGVWGISQAGWVLPEVAAKHPELQ
ncbi:MspA family porin, partial [Mycolicibacterium farcinogenes]|nr:MspA family porin [Mycolicibacterium farcinogenes]